MDSKIRKAVIPAAGLGTRFLPATKSQPKEMLPIVDKPTIQYIVEEAIASGVESILIVTGRSKRAIEDHFDRSVELEMELAKKEKGELLELVRDISDLVDIHYVRQKTPRGLGHAIYCARTFVGNEPFAVLLGDDIIHSRVPCLQQLADFFATNPGIVLGVQEVPLEDVSKYGIIKPGEEAVGGAVTAVDFVEKPSGAEAPSRLAVLGRYILTPEVFAALEDTQPGAGGEIQLTDAIRSLIGTVPVYAFPFQGRRYDVGNKLGFLQATVEFALRREDLGDEFRCYLSGLAESGWQVPDETAKRRTLVSNTIGEMQLVKTRE